jgi:hypothetical protein
VGTSIIKQATKYFKFQRQELPLHLQLLQSKKNTLLLHKSQQDPPKLRLNPSLQQMSNMKALVFVNKAVQTLPIDEFAPPSQINTHTFVEQATQTLPQPTTCNAETQTQPWDEQ